jgi:hypothetical protein
LQELEEPKIRKRKQKRRITSYLSNISKQVDKHGNQINKVTMMIHSIQQEKQKQTKSTKGAGASQSSLQSIKQIQFQVSQLQKQVTWIQNDIQRIRTTSGIGIKTTSKADINPESKKSRSFKGTRVRRSRNEKKIKKRANT